jgi:pimeloyl-ACP methyl ester carboxylesterase
LAVINSMSPDTVLNDFQACRSYEAAPAWLAAINTPCLILSGEDDQLNPVAGAKAMAQALPAGQIKLAAKAGHMLHRQEPELVAAESLRFIAQTF